LTISYHLASNFSARSSQIAFVLFGLVLTIAKTRFGPALL
jgi:hypothetical protein